MYVEWIDLGQYVIIGTTVYYIAIGLFFYQSEIRRLLMYGRASKLENIRTEIREEDLPVNSNSSEEKIPEEKSLDDFMSALHQLLDTCQNESIDQTTILRLTGDLLSTYSINVKHPLYDTVVRVVVEAIGVRLNMSLTVEDIKRYTAA